MIEKNGIEIIAFKNLNEWEQWLEKHHQTKPGVFMRLYKKGTGKESIDRSDALDLALCYGWIDAIVHKYDEDSYIQKFVPRRANSIWSKINIGHIERLTKEGRMKPMGLAKVEEAKQNGQWDRAYDSPSTMVPPKDFLQELKKYPEAEAFYNTLNKTNTFAIAFQLQTAKKPETRERRLHKLISLMKKKEKIH